MDRYRVAFIGDSFIKGTRRGGLLWANCTRLLNHQDGWRTSNHAVGGTGYVNPGTAAPFEQQQLASAVATRPDALVVVGSMNDSWFPPEQVHAAAANLYAAFRQQRPDARLVVVGPIWPDQNPPERVTTARDAIREAAEDAGADWVDPLKQAWFTDAPRLISGDGIHPNNAGHAMMAARLADTLAGVRTR